MPGIEPFVGEADKERLQATLRGEIPDRVPHFEALIEDQHVEKLLGRQAGNTLGVGGDPAKGSEAAEVQRDADVRLVDLVDQHQHLARVGPECLWVAEHEGEVVGLVGLIVDEQGAEVEPIVVATTHRDKGIGRAVLHRMVEEARKLGVRYLSVKPVARNVEAISFYYDFGQGASTRLEPLESGHSLRLRSRQGRRHPCCHARCIRAGVGCEVMEQGR